MPRETYYWFAAVILFIVIEIITPQFVSIWFAFGSVAALIAAALNAPIILQVSIFVIISGILVFLTRPLYKKFISKKVTPTNADSLIGDSAVVTVAINNDDASGQVKVKGQIWSAYSTDGSLIPEGEKVIVKDIKGVRLYVEKIKE